MGIVGGRRGKYALATARVTVSDLAESVRQMLDAVVAASEDRILAMGRVDHLDRAAEGVTLRFALGRMRVGCDDVVLAATPDSNAAGWHQLRAENSSERDHVDVVEPRLEGLARERQTGRERSPRPSTGEWENG